MGVSTDGQICFGIVFEDGFEFPWDTEEYDYDVEEWWREVNGFKSTWSPWTDEGEYKEGITKDDPRFDTYYDERRKWLEENPIPIEVVNYCSGDCPMYMLAVPSSSKSNSRGYPVEFDPNELKVSAEEYVLITEFCKKYNIETTETPKWWLSSYWG